MAVKPCCSNCGRRGRVGHPMAMNRLYPWGHWLRCRRCLRLVRASCVGRAKGLLPKGVRG